MKLVIIVMTKNQILQFIQINSRKNSYIYIVDIQSSSDTVLIKERNRTIYDRTIEVVVAFNHYNESDT